MPDTNVAPPSDAKAEWIARVLGVAIAQAAAPPAGASASLVALQKARLAWATARRNAGAELQAVGRDLRAAVLAHNADEEAADEYEEADLDGGVEQLGAALDALDETLVDALDDALNAGADDRPARVAAARAVLGRFRAFLGGSRLLAAVDGNGFRPCTVRRDLDAALKTVADAL